ncbi:MAG: hypothetical protein QOE35_4160 [Actinomycetota bacterium]
MLGGILIAVITAVLLPTAFLVGGHVICMIMGWSLWKNGEATHEGSELIDLNT